MNAFTVADDTSLVALIHTAEQRLVFLAPAASQAVAEALIERLEQLGANAVTITLDVDAETYRLGYGDPGTLDMLYEATRRLGKPLRKQAGLRVGLIISDDVMMMYAPTPQLIEAGPRLPQAHNAIVIEPVPPIIIQELGLGEVGVIDQTVGLDIAPAAVIQEVRKDLEQNPPQKFDIARTVHVFNAYFEFVEFELIGTKIDKKIVRIPADLMGLAKNDKTKRLLTATFRVIESSSDLSGSHLEHDKKLIINKFLKTLPTYGNVILRTRKPEFEKEVQSLRTAVTEFQKKIREKLQSAMDENRKALLEALLPSVHKNPPKAWTKSDGSKPDEETVKQLLSDTLRRAFGPAERLIGRMEVNLRFKGVTYELLQDETFIKLARAAFPDLERLLDEYDAGPGMG